MTTKSQRERYVATLEKLGGSAGNGRLREQLGWDEGAYAEVKAALVAEGVVAPGRGRGGSVSLVGHQSGRQKVIQQALKEQFADFDLPVAAGSDAPEPASAKPSRNKTARPKANPAKNGNGANLGFEAELFKAADKLRGNMEPSDYKHVALGLILLKHISDSFEAKRAELLAEYPEGAEDPDEYAAENVFWVPKDGRWSHLRANARQPGIGKLVDEAMLAIEKVNPSLKSVLPKDYARPALNAVMLGELIDLISGIALGEARDEARDVLGRVYEYFLGQFAGSEGKRGGEFYTPRSVVRVMVAMLEPYKGRVYDPCCGSGGMFVQSETFVEAHGGRLGDIAIYGQESNYTTWRLAKMNLAVRGIDADIKWNSEGSFHKDELPDLRADFVLANPPFNVSDWGGERLREDARWAFGIPPAGQRQLRVAPAHPAPLGAERHRRRGTGERLDVVHPVGRGQHPQGHDRRRRGRLHDRFAGQLFYSTQIPACLWFLARNKKNGRFRDRTGEVLFIDARKLGRMVDRTRKEFTDEDIAEIADTYHRWREGRDYANVPGFCKAASREEIAGYGYVLTPGRYVGAAVEEDDDVPFVERFAALREKLEEQFAEGDRLTATNPREAGGSSPAMTSWSTEPLEDCLDALIDYRGKSPPKSEEGIPVLSAKVVKTAGLLRPIEQTIALDYYPIWMTRGFPRPGDVVMTTEAPLGEVIQLNDETAAFALGQRIVCMRGKAKKLDNTFLRYLLTSPQSAGDSCQPGDWHNGPGDQSEGPAFYANFLSESLGAARYWGGSIFTR